jgi:hypothetical protein
MSPAVTSATISSRVGLYEWKPVGLNGRHKGLTEKKLEEKHKKVEDGISTFFCINGTA